MRRLWPTVAAGLCLALALPAPASAGHPRKRNAQTKLGKQTLRTHVDPKRALRRGVRVPATAAAVTDLPATWCASAGGDLSNAPQVRVLYARPSDVADGFAAQADAIQLDIELIRNRLDASSGASPRTVRFDMKNCNSALHVDLQAIVLPKTKAQYEGGDTFALLRADLDAATAEALGARANYLVYVDGVTEPGASGQADVPVDERPGRENGANQGHLFAFLYDPAFGGGAPADSARRATALHELTHTLGAVQDGAPHSTRAGHCTDNMDIMCYDDDGTPAPTVVCNNGSSEGLFEELFDCGTDDYWNPSPAGGTYLASNWNTFNSEFLCASSACDLAQSGPAVSLAVGGKQLRGSVVTFTASAPAGTVFDWDLDGDGQFEVTTGETPQATRVYSGTGDVTVRVRATGANGAFTLAQQPVSIAEPVLPSPDYTFAPTPPLVGQEVTFDASPTQDPDGIIERFAWDLNDDGVLDIDNGLSKVMKTTFASPGARFVWLQVDYPTGFRAKAYSVDVRSRPTPPPPAATASLAVAKTRLKALIARGLPLALECPAPCRVTAKLSIARKLARKLRLRSATIGTVSKSAAAGKTSVVLKLTRAAKRALRRQRRLAATLGITITGPGAPLAVKRKLTF